MFEYFWKFILSEMNFATDLHGDVYNQIAEKFPY